MGSPTFIGWLSNVTFKYDSYFIFKRMKILPKRKGQEKKKKKEQNKTKHSRIINYIINFLDLG